MRSTVKKILTGLMLNKIILLKRRRKLDNCFQLYWSEEILVRVEFFVENNCLILVQLEGRTTLYVCTQVADYSNPIVTVILYLLQLLEKGNKYYRKLGMI